MRGEADAAEAVREYATVCRQRAAALKMLAGSQLQRAARWVGAKGWEWGVESWELGAGSWELGVRRAAWSWELGEQQEVKVWCVPSFASASAQVPPGRIFPHHLHLKSSMLRHTTATNWLYLGPNVVCAGTWR